MNLASALTTADQFIAANASGNLVIDYHNYETQVSAVNDTSHGILDVTTISAYADNGNPLPLATWAGDGVSGGDQLTGQFDSLTVKSITTSVPGGPTVVDFTGGELALYDVANGTFNPAAGGIGDPVKDIFGGATCPSPLVTANFASGIISTNGTVTLTATLMSTSPLTGHGAGYLDTATNSFGTGSENNLIHHQAINTAFGPRDLFLNSSLSAPCAGTPGITSRRNWPVYSSDPVTNPVPGAGVGGLGRSRAGGVGSLEADPPGLLSRNTGLRLTDGFHARARSDPGSARVLGAWPQSS